MNALIDNYYTFGSYQVKLLAKCEIVGKLCELPRRTKSPGKISPKTTKSIRDSVIVRFIRILGSYSVTKLINYY